MPASIRTAMCFPTHRGRALRRSQSGKLSLGRRHQEFESPRCRRRRSLRGVEPSGRAQANDLRSAHGGPPGPRQWRRTDAALSANQFLRCSNSRLIGGTAHDSSSARSLRHWSCWGTAMSATPCSFGSSGNSMARRRPYRRDPAIWPDVSIVIAAHNEEAGHRPAHRKFAGAGLSA